MKPLITSFLFAFQVLFAIAQQPSSVKEYMQSFPTYGFSDPNPIPLLSPVYPYFRYDGFTDKPQQKQWKIIELENEYIKVLITPEIGGKIWAAIEKKSGRSFIYYNHTVKFRDVAMRGPWTSGGLEANYGIIGHTPNCATPVDYTTRINEDGSASCIIGVLDLLTRTNWRVEINLPKDKAYFTTQSFWYNATAQEQPYYHWMNLGMKAGGNLEFVFPGNKYIGHNGEYADWPINKSNGKHINFYEENNFGGYKSYHVFGKYTHFFGAYYHDEDNGMVRYGTYDDKAGKKIWIWGLSRQGMIWEKMLTDSDGQYVEIQSGRLFNQNADKSSLTPFKHVGFAPYATDGWKEYWYPVNQTKGISEANAIGALNLQNEKGWLKIYFSPVQVINDTLKIIAGNKIIYNKPLQLTPLKVFSDSIQANINEDETEVILGDHMLEYSTGSHKNDLSRPTESPADFDWSTAYGLYLQGKEYMDEKLYDKAEAKLTASLEKEHNFFPALVKMAELLYRNMRYEEALKTITKAISINTEAGDANYYYGLINAQLNRITDAKDGFSIAALTQDYRSAAYTGLAALFAKEHNYDQVIAYTKKAIDFNRYNMNALMLQAVAYRYQNNTVKAKEANQYILSFDPLNHFAMFEKYKLAQTDESKKQFIAAIRNELPTETFAELAIWYYNNGYMNETKEVFTLSPASAEAAYWLAFLQGKKVDCAAINPQLSFPFRSETAMVLETLLKTQQDWLLKYQLALIYRDRNRIEECKNLLVNCGDEPGYAPFYATRYLIFKNDEKDLQKALSLDATQWRYHKLLTEYYNEHKQYQNALNVITPFYNTHRDNYIMGMLYAKTLLLNKAYKKADQTLSTLNIIPFEGATDGRSLYREAKLMQAIELMQQKNYKKAQTFIQQARIWPENLGVGKPYDEDIDTRLEDWMDYLCYQKSGRGDSDKLLQQVKSFKPEVDNTVRNFIPSNALVTAWAIEKKEGKEKANEWLNEQMNTFPELKTTWTWVKDMLDKKPAADSSTMEEDAGVRILTALATMK
ncbi:MAG: DUF5107 domain-containing protein [Agriterribacter sp.]